MGCGDISKTSRCRCRSCCLPPIAQHCWPDPFATFSVKYHVGTCPDRGLARFPADSLGPLHRALKPRCDAAHSRYGSKGARGASVLHGSCRLHEGGLRLPVSVSGVIVRRNDAGHEDDALGVLRWTGYSHLGGTMALNGVMPQHSSVQSVAARVGCGEGLDR